MAKQKSSGWLDKYTAAVSDATAQAKPGPVFLGNPYAKEMAKRQTYLSPQGKSAAPAMKQAALDRAQSEKTSNLNKKIATYAQNIGGALELAAPFTGPAMPILGAIGTGLDVGGSTYLAGKDISEGNYGSAAMNAGFGALGVAGFAPMVKYNRGLNAAVNTVDDVSDVAGLYNSYDNLGREYAGKVQNLKDLEYANVNIPTDKLSRAAVPNPLALLDQFTPRLDPIKAMGIEMDIMDLSPLNLIPGYGKKLSGKNQTFRKFGNSLDDVIQRQALSPAGGSDVFRMGKDQIVSEGNWAARNQPSENYPGVFEATFDMNNPNANLSALQIPDRNGVLMVDRAGRRLPEIPLTEPGMSFNRRLPFSTRYVPIDKTKLMNNQFQLATQLPHVQSLVEKYGLAVGGAGAYGYFRGGEEGAKEKIDFINRYTVDPVLDVFKGGIDKATELLPKKKDGGWLEKYDEGGTVAAAAESTGTVKPGPVSLMTDEQKRRLARREQMQRTHDAKELAKAVAKSKTYISATPNMTAELKAALSEDRKREEYIANSPLAQTFTSMSGGNEALGSIAAKQFPYTVAAGASAMLGPEVLPFLRATGAALNQPIAGVAGLTANNLLNAGFAYEAGMNLPNVAESFKEVGRNPTLGNVANATSEVGLTALGALPFAAEVAPGVKAAIDASKESGLLSNAYKINPFAYKPEEGMMYRGLGEEGFKDALESGVFRSKQNVEPFMSGRFDISKSFGTNPYFTPRFKTAESYGSKYLAEVPKEAANWRQRYARTDWSQVADRAIPINEGRILQKDWLQGYKPVEMPTASSIDDVAGGLTEIAQPINQPWQLQELPGLHLKSTMEGEAISKIVEPKTGLVNVEQALGIIGKESGGADKVALIKQSLGENLPKKMGYNEFRKVVQDRLVPLERQFVTHASDYGLNRLNYDLNYGRNVKLSDVSSKEYIPDIQAWLAEKSTTKGVKFKSVSDTFEGQGTLKVTGIKPNGEEFTWVVSKKDLPSFRSKASNDIVENQTLLLSNEGKFGRGSSAHNNPEETLGHAHFLRDAESPDVLTVTQIQSDAFQGTHRIMPKASERMTPLEQRQFSFERLKQSQERNKSVLNRMKTEGLDEAGLPVYDYQIKQFEDIVKQQERANAFAKADLENFSQKQLLDKNHQERYLQEIVDYAGKRGDVGKIRLPTSETAAKVQNYTPKKVWNVKPPENGDKIILSDGTVGKVTDDTFFNSIDVTTEDGRRVLIDMTSAGKEPPVKSINDVEVKESFQFHPEEQTILKKYSEQPKTIKKLFGEEPKIVTDGKGNTWYEFDIPKKFKEGKGEIKAFGLTPALIGAGAVGAAAASQQPEQQRNGGWLDKYNDGGPVQENYNNYSVSAPEGFQGDGYSNVGRNYSPAWGGQFEDGGEIAQTGKTVPFDQWYKTVPKAKNDTINYNLRRAYDLAPQKELDAFVKNPKAHLMSVYENPDTGIYEFMKSKNHSTIDKELNWYNGKGGTDFRNNYNLDTTGNFYRYVPKKKMAMGGSAPGDADYNAPRNINPAPYNGPGAKKTMASAQNGTTIPGEYELMQEPDDQINYDSENPAFDSASMLISQGLLNSIPEANSPAIDINFNQKNLLAEHTFMHQPGWVGADDETDQDKRYTNRYMLKRTVSPYTTDEDVRLNTLAPTRPQDVNFISNYANSAGYDSESEYPTKVPYEGEKHWNIDRFAIDPEFSSLYPDLENTKEYTDKTQQRRNTLTDMYKYFMLQNKGDRDVAWKQANEFMTKEIDPRISGPVYDVLHNSDPLGWLSGSITSMIPNEYRRTYDSLLNEAKLPEEQRSYIANEFLKNPSSPEQVKGLAMDWLVNYKKMSPKEAETHYNKLPKNDKEYNKQYLKSKKKQDKSERTTLDLSSPGNFQNGGEMKYYQEGLDFQPKTISKNGSKVIKDDRGQWAHPGKVTQIGSNQITMQGVPYPVLGISDTGDIQMMYPNQEYNYNGSSVTEYPMMKEGGALQLTKLDQLTNFTNYNTKQPGGWLDKYQD